MTETRNNSNGRIKSVENNLIIANTKFRHEDKNDKHVTVEPNKDKKSNTNYFLINKSDSKR